MHGWRKTTMKSGAQHSTPRSAMKEPWGLGPRAGHITLRRLDFLSIRWEVRKIETFHTTPSSKIPGLFLEVTLMGKGKSILCKFTHKSWLCWARKTIFCVFPCAPSGILATGSVFRRECKPGAWCKGLGVSLLVLHASKKSQSRESLCHHQWAKWSQKEVQVESC